MPEESAGHVSEEPLPCMLGTVCAVSIMAPPKPHVPEEPEQSEFGSRRQTRWFFREASVWCGQETPLSPSLLLCEIISLGNNKEEGASRLLLHGLGVLLSLVPQVPVKSAKPLLMLISD